MNPDPLTTRVAARGGALPSTPRISDCAGAAVPTDPHSRRARRKLAARERFATTPATIADDDAEALILRQCAREIRLLAAGRATQAIAASVSSAWNAAQAGAALRELARAADGPALLVLAWSAAA